MSWYMIRLADVYLQAACVQTGYKNVDSRMSTRLRPKKKTVTVST